MILAAEARVKSLTNKDTKAFINKVEALIIDAATAGERNIALTEHVNQFHLKAIADAGYTIEQMPPNSKDWPSDMPLILISW